MKDVSNVAKKYVKSAGNVNAGHTTEYGWKCQETSATGRDM